MIKTNFVKSTVILVIASIIIKILGFAYQIIIVRLIGTEPIGVLNMVWPLYSALTIVVAAGLPLAISKMVSEEVALERYLSSFKIIRVSYGIIAVMGVCVISATLLLAPFYFEHGHSDERVRWCFYVLLPGIILVPVASILRGYFQGLQQMYYTSFAQVVEQITRFSIGIVLVIQLQPYGIKFIAMGLAAASIVGELLGLIAIIYFYHRGKRKMLELSYGNTTVPETQQLVRSLMNYGLPTTASRLIATLAMAAEASIIPTCLLSIGYDNSQAASIYGEFSGVAVTLITIPCVLTSSLSQALLPAVSEAEAKAQGGVLEGRISEALRLTYILCLPVIVILFLKATSICDLLFDLPEAGTTVRYLSFGAIFMYLAQTSNGIVQGLGLTRIILFNTIVSSVIKLVGIYYLTGISDLHINGTALAYVVFFAVQCALNLSVINKRVCIRFNRGQLFLPIFNALFMVINLLWMTRFLANYLSTELVTIISICFSGLVYLAILLMTQQLSLQKLRG